MSGGIGCDLCFNRK
jgi:hypothetical protein